ncbi:MAG TPA: pyridoxal-phosphate dependent enzyme, partial [Gemmatimonadales bacterium]|nr:pyridoxal-phosphate dependent enzyme [Gemmatimonadales bacterium]
HPAPVFSVPSGNFGNLTAGLMAKRMGLPVSGLVAATNANDVVPRFLRTGTLRPQPSQATLSSAMDVGNPSNLARILWLCGGDHHAVARDVMALSHSDEQTRTCIRDVYQRFGYVLDPHSAVGYLGLQAALQLHPDAVGICLATAHPAKYRETVEPAIGRSLAIPERLAAVLERKPVVQRIPADLTSLQAYLAD